MIEPRTRAKAATPWSAWMFILVAAMALCGVIAAALVYRHYFGSAVSASSSEWNNFGTFFGGLLGPILSMLAFFALVYTIFLQEQQLSLARATLKAADDDKELTRKQLEAAVETQKRTAEALALQNKLGSDQATRAAFFEMISLHNQIVQDTAFKDYEPIAPGVPPREVAFEGRRAFRYFYERVFEPAYSLESRKNDRLGAAKRSLREFDRFLFGELNASYSDELAHYFRNLYRILRFIDESALEQKDKDALAGILRAQLSNSELGLIFYNGLSALGENGLKRLLEEYRVLQHLSPTLCINRESAAHYHVKAFGKAKDKFFADQGLREPQDPAAP
ncbi:putative phage abortive infection protein [Scleromatobacter humisilvae]|uniref:Phage abortive infection protein n=1 Tax=Scleromatobacter humisilvae TaxID=2897159 RepID=A0A9X2C0R2_9BURK|nr:putative phage abortive infection protein [Scleromatobacter humisilvae]MCK9684994.1 putative phage abortive infection protein [Scleromatobacter humisilvae]